MLTGRDREIRATTSNNVLLMMPGPWMMAWGGGQRHAAFFGNRPGGSTKVRSGDMILGGRQFQHRGRVGGVRASMRSQYRHSARSIAEESIKRDGSSATR